jgi:hypothetical protein
MESDDDEWQTCIVDKSYEINSNYPHQIRVKRIHTILKETLTSDGNLSCALNKVQYLKHRLIARQFLDNKGTSSSCRPHQWNSN